jgi:uncharacterized protein
MTGIIQTTFHGEAMFPCPDSPPLLLNDEEMDALEAVLVSDAVPEDCMDLEMLDGFLAGVLLSPAVIERDYWLPEVWSAYGEANFGAGSAVQNAIRLVLAYYNEIATTLGRENRDERWTPLCFTTEQDDARQGVGDNWIDGFMQGLELWPEDWQEGLPAEIADDVQNALRQVVAQWEDEDADAADDETRLGWLEATCEAVNNIFARWRSIGLPSPGPIEPEPPSPPSKEAGSNDPCPCGSGKKYKKCCGAASD